MLVTFSLRDGEPNCVAHSLTHSLNLDTCAILFFGICGHFIHTMYDFIVNFRVWLF